MSQSTYFYNLYCLNMDCGQSIYWSSVEARAAFTAENLVATHLCACCSQPLSSAMDFEIKHMTAQVGVISGKPYHKSSH